MKKLIELDRNNAFFDDKLHVINDILISYGFFLKVYVIQEKFRFLNLGDQEKLNQKAELISCVSNQFNMYTVRAMNQDSRRKDYLPVYISIDCATSLKHYNNYYFSSTSNSAFIAHYHEQGKKHEEKWDPSMSLLQHVF